jgi:hypothetical protein
MHDIVLFWFKKLDLYAVNTIVSVGMAFAAHRLDGISAFKERMV